MGTASHVFFNGIAGVFTGIGVLYIMMRILAVTAGRPAPDAATSVPKT